MTYTTGTRVITSDIEWGTMDTTTHTWPFKVITGTPHAPYLFRVIEGRQAVQFAFRMATGTFEWTLTRRGDDGIERFVSHGDTGLRSISSEDAERIGRDLLAQEE
jgi:hypothetical protein